MSNLPQKSAGLALILGSFLMIMTMVLHPAGGNFEHLVKIFNIIVISHSLAILSIPFSLIGFRGLQRRLGQAPLLSTSAFAIMVVGLGAGVAAAAINGLALPLFVRRYAEAPEQMMETIRLILNYGSSLNHAFDFILIGAVCLSMLLWSLAILITKDLPSWIGFLGITLSLAAFVMILGGFHFVDLHGFRLFIFGWMVWVLSVGVVMMKSPDRL